MPTFLQLAYSELKGVIQPQTARAQKRQRAVKRYHILHSQHFFLVSVSRTCRGGFCNGCTNRRCCQDLVQPMCYSIHFLKQILTHSPWLAFSQLNSLLNFANVTFDASFHVYLPYYSVNMLRTQIMPVLFHHDLAIARDKVYKVICEQIDIK